jgi:hypothetical protein
MLPANQRLNTNNGATVKIDLRLVIQFELLPLKCPMQLAFYPLSLYNTGIPPLLEANR